jgi:methionyl-tRNA formyltransferase
MIFLGMAGALPARVMDALLRAPAEAVGVICAEPRISGQRRRWSVVSRLRAVALRRNDPTWIARSRGLDCLRVREGGAPEIIEWVRQRGPDLMCITTFPHLLGAELLAVPRIGTINLHTSLLPRYRGPAPLFWMARAGETQGGVTIHWVDAGEDTGDIILQEPFPIPDGMASEELQRRVAEVGSRLMRDAVERIAVSGRSVPAQPQSGGHRNPRPRPEDAQIGPAWGARRIYNFVRLARKWQMPYLVDGGARHCFDDALWLPERRSQETAIQVGRRRTTIIARDGAVVLWKRGRFTKALDDLRALRGWRQ